ncbi:MAG: DegT/DnrJ/EryC1/StrS family aminotransferase [Candidatus Polarisedimenticolia bacterium]
MIPQMDLQGQMRILEREVVEALRGVLASGRFIGGPEVEELERGFAALCGVEHAIAVASGTDAVRFALMAALGKSAAVESSHTTSARVTPGASHAARPHPVPSRAASPTAPSAAPEVITSPMTFIATTEAITQAGAVPVFADIDPATFALDPAGVERALTARTRAIVPVHLYGQPGDLEPLLAMARSRGRAVIEDACQAHGARHRGRPVGSLGDAGAFSFYPTKNLGGCGEGGMVTTRRPDIAQRVRRLRDHGQSEKYLHAEEGYNGRLDALQAAILRVKLRHLPAWNDRRRAIAALYRDRLAVLETRGLLVLPREHPDARHVYHQFTVRIPADASPRPGGAGAAPGVEPRDRVRAELRERGVETGVHYPIPLHLQPCYAWMGLREGSFPAAERAAREVVSLPMFPELSDTQVDEVCDALAAILVGRPGGSQVPPRKSD